MGPKVLIAFALAGGLLWASAVFAGRDASSPGYGKLREQMVYSQIEKRGVRDARTLAAMRKVERHLFVPEPHRRQAYSDHPLSIGEGQTISQPYIVALMTEVLELDGSEKVLEIGTGSGYQAAVLGELAKEVYTIEIVRPLGEKAEKILSQLHYANVHVKIGDGYKGWPEHAPFDAIIVTCAPTDIPKPLVEQLAEGGRMVIPVGEAGDQNLVLLTKRNGAVKKKKIIPVRFVPMTRKNGGVY